MAQLKPRFTPLQQGAPIVDQRGGPVPFFQRLINTIYTNLQGLLDAANSAQSTAEDAQATADAAVPQTRQINTTLPLSGGGPLSADLTLTHATSGVSAGSYTSADITVDAEGHVIAASNGTGGAGSVSSQSGTTYTAVLGDANTYIRFSNASSITFTIPPNSSVAFATGTVIEMEQAGAGALSVAAGAGVTINSRASDLTLAGQYSVAFVKKVATDTWTMNGDL